MKQEKWRIHSFACQDNNLDRIEEYMWNGSCARHLLAPPSMSELTASVKKCLPAAKTKERKKEKQHLSVLLIKLDRWTHSDVHSPNEDDNEVLK